MLHEVLSNSQNDGTASGGNRPPANQRASYLYSLACGASLTNRGASGAMTQDQAYAAHTVGPRDPSSKVYLLDLVTNDMRLRPQTEVGKRWFRDFLTACAVGALFGAKKTARTGGSSVGSWTNTQVDSLGMFTTSQGAKKTFSVSGKAVAVCWFADNHNSSKGVFEVRIDGELVDTLTTYTGLELSPYGTTYNGLRYGPAARLYGVADGVHSVEVKCVSSGTNAYLSYVAGLGEQTAFPKLFIGTGSKVNGVDDLVSQACRQIVLDLVSKLSGLGIPVKAVDTWTVLDPLQHFMPDGIHWNAAGHLAIEQCIISGEREPQTLTYPTAWNTTLTVDLDADGLVTAYDEA